MKLNYLLVSLITFFSINAYAQNYKSAYDFKGDVVDELDVVPSAEGVTIIAQSDITQYWGTGYNSTVAELAFDLQVIVNNKVWTPIIGTIKVQADVTGGL